MKRTQIHLNQTTQQKSPTPLTPVDEAWDKMAKLLDLEMPVPDQKSKKRAFTISFSQFAVFVLAAMIVVGGGTFITLKTIENRKEIQTTKHSVKNQKLDSLINKTVQIEDSATSAKTDVQTSISTNQTTNEKKVLRQQQNNNNQTPFSTAATQTNTPQKVVSVKKSKLNIITDTNAVLKSNKSDSITNSIEKQPKKTLIDSVSSQNHHMNSIFLKDKKSTKVELETKTIINDLFRTEQNSQNINPSEKEKGKTVNRGSNYPRTNHLFVGLSRYDGLLFSKNTSKRIYSYGEILTIGIRNTKYKLTVETGIGFQSLEYHVPYNRKLYTQGTGIYDSTITVSSYKYSRYNAIIPFLITKEILHYNNIFLDITTGINTSLFLSKQRLFNQLPADIKLVEDSYPISNLNFSFAISPQFRWDINEKFSLNINAGGIFYLNSLYQNYSLKPIGINLSAGIHYFL